MNYPKLNIISTIVTPDDLMKQVQFQYLDLDYIPNITTNSALAKLIKDDYLYRIKKYFVWYSKSLTTRIKLKKDKQYLVYSNIDLDYYIIDDNLIVKNIMDYNIIIPLTAEYVLEIRKDVALFSDTININLLIDNKVFMTVNLYDASEFNHLSLYLLTVLHFDFKQYFKTIKNQILSYFALCQL